MYANLQWIKKGRSPDFLGLPILKAKSWVFAWYLRIKAKFTAKF